MTEIFGRNRQASLDTRRVPLEGKIRLDLGGDQQIQARTANLSAGGFFVVTAAPASPGRTARFVLRVVPRWKPIEGQARAVWARTEAEAPDRPAGMGMEILDIDARGRLLLRWLVSQHLRTGALPKGKEPSIEELKPAPSPRSVPADDVAFPEFIAHSRPARLPAHSTAPAARRWLLAGLAIVVAATLAGAFWGRSPEPRLERPAAPVEAAPVEAAPIETAAPRVASPAAVERPSALSPDADTVAEVEAALSAWAAAWSEQRTEAYLASYASAFAPESGEPREAWAALRRQRVTSPAFIELTIEDLEVEELPGGGPGEPEARASFRQTYRSDTYGDEVDKVLIWIRESGRWKILRERSKSS